MMATKGKGRANQAYKATQGASTTVTKHNRSLPKGGQTGVSQHSRKLSPGQRLGRSLRKARTEAVKTWKGVNKKVKNLRKRYNQWTNETALQHRMRDLERTVTDVGTGNAPSGESLVDQADKYYQAAQKLKNPQLIAQAEKLQGYAETGWAEEQGEQGREYWLRQWENKPRPQDKSAKPKSRRKFNATAKQILNR